MTRKIVLVTVGTRPEAIKMAPVIQALGDRPERLTIIENSHDAALLAVRAFAA